MKRILILLLLPSLGACSVDNYYYPESGPVVEHHHQAPPAPARGRFNRRAVGPVINHQHQHQAPTPSVSKDHNHQGAYVGRTTPPPPTVSVGSKNAPLPPRVNIAPKKAIDHNHS